MCVWYVFFQVTPDLIKSQTTSAENGNGEDAQTKQAIYNLLKEGYNNYLYFTEHHSCL